MHCSAIYGCCIGVPPFCGSKIDLRDLVIISAALPDLPFRVAASLLARPIIGGQLYQVLAGEAHVQTNVPICALILIVQSLQLSPATVALTVLRDSWGLHGVAHIRDDFSPWSVKTQVDHDNIVQGTACQGAAW